MKIRFSLNGKEITLEAAPDEHLIDILRDREKLTGSKKACGIGRCGACTVLVDGRAINACLFMAYQVDGCAVLTVEGLDQHPLGAAVRAGLIEENAFQCGYCAPGVSIALVALLQDDPNAGAEALKAGLEGNICRCTGYHSIIRGALNAAARVRALAHPSGA